MSTIECQFCGARLIPPDGGAVAEVRCNRCGRRTKVGAASSAKDRPRSAPLGASSPPSIPSARRAPPPAFEALPKEAPRVDAYPRQATLPPPLPTSSRNRGVGRIAAVAAAAGVGLAVAVAAYMYGGTPGGSGGVPTRQLAQATGPSTQHGNPDPMSPAAEAGSSNGAGVELPADSAIDPMPSAHPPQPVPANPPAPTVAPPLRGTAGLAASIRVEPLFNEEVYANSELALADLETHRLELHESRQPDWFLESFPPPVAAGPLHDAFKAVVRAEFELKAAWLFANRPVFSVAFIDAPKGTRVRIRLRVQNDSAKSLLTADQATEREWITLDETQHPGVVWHHESSGPNAPAHWEVGLQPLWDAAQLASITAPQQLNFELQVTYGDGSEDDLATKKITVRPPQHVELRYPLCLGFIGLVNPEHPWVTQLIDEVNQSSLSKHLGAIVGAGGDASDALFGAYLLWRELRARGLRYQNLPGAGGQEIQRARPIHEALSARNANCVDGSLLFCSMLERLGLDSMLMYPPGHAMVVFGDGDDWWELETTRLGDEPRCSDDFYRSVMEKRPKLQQMATRLEGEDRRDFVSFIGALESGRDEAARQFARIVEGDPEQKLAPVNELVAIFNDARRPEEERLGAAVDLKTRFMTICPLSSARAAGIKPIPLPRDFSDKLPPQPARTR